MNAQNLHRLFFAALLATLCACGSANPAPTATDTPTQSLFSTMIAPPARSTLPPTWTPSFTPLPSATFTLTPTPSLTPTLTAADICDGFKVLYELSPGEQFAWEGGIPILAGTEADDVVIRFNAVHQQTGESKLVEIPGGNMVVAELPANLLPQPGLYDWTLSVYSETYGDLCARSGTFIVLSPSEQRPGSNE